jgi:cardiolipin synthase
VGEQRTEITSDRVLTIPNAISFLRLLGVPLFLWLLLVPEADLWAILVLVLAGASDWLDGVLARRWNQITRIGQLLDPLADRLYILATLVGFGVRGIVPWWFIGFLVARDLVLLATVPVLRRRGLIALPVHFLGKAATFNLLYAFPLLLLGDSDGTFGTIAQTFGWAFVIWGTALYWWSAVLYLVQLREVVRTVPVKPART